jgi:hypothetical protein
MSDLKQLFSIGSSGQNAYIVDPDWAREATKAGIRCGTCHALKRESLDELRFVCVDEHEPKVSVGGIFGLWNGAVVRDDVAQLIGQAHLTQACHKIDVRTRRGDPLERIHLYVEREPRGVIRGGVHSNVKLCAECQRLLYSLMPEDIAFRHQKLDEEYVLSDYWDEGRHALLLDSHLICNRQFVDGVRASKQFGKMVVTTLNVRAEPLDGLPKEYGGLVRELLRQGRVLDLRRAHL